MITANNIYLTNGDGCVIGPVITNTPSVNSQLRSKKIKHETVFFFTTYLPNELVLVPVCNIDFCLRSVLL